MSIIGASLSEPHTYDEDAAAVCMYIQCKLHIYKIIYNYILIYMLLL